MRQCLPPPRVSGFASRDAQELRYLCVGAYRSRSRSRTPVVWPPRSLACRRFFQKAELVDQPYALRPLLAVVLVELHRLAVLPRDRNNAPGPARAKEIQFNKQLAESSGGLWAPLSKQESSWSISCSHFNQGCRAIKHGCVTNEEKLMDSFGKFNILHITGNDPVLLDSIENVWGWYAIAAYARGVFPRLANLGQKALGADRAPYSNAS